MHEHCMIEKIMYTYVILTYDRKSILTLVPKSELPAHHIGVFVVPQIVTDCAPCFIIAHLNTTLHRGVITSESDVTSQSDITL